MHRPADHPTAEQADHDRQKQSAFLGCNVSDFANPGLVRCINAERAIEHIGRNRQVMEVIGGDSEPLFALAADAMDLNQCLRLLFAYTHALVAQRTPYSGPAITAASLSVSGRDMDEQRFIVQISTCCAVSLASRMCVVAHSRWPVMYSAPCSCCSLAMRSYGLDLVASSYSESSALGFPPSLLAKSVLFGSFLYADYALRSFGWATMRVAAISMIGGAWLRHRGGLEINLAP